MTQHAREQAQDAVSGADLYFDVDEAVDVSQGTESVVDGAHDLQASRYVDGLKQPGWQSLFGPFSLATGIDDLINGDSVLEQVGGGLDAFAGGVETLGLAGGLFGSESLVAASAWAGPAAALAGALATGLSIGNKGNASARERGFLGKNRWGENRNWSDVFGEVAFNPATSANAGPALAVAGIGAAGTWMYDLGETIGAIPRAPISTADVEKMLRAAQQQQQRMDGDSQQTFDQMTKAGVPEDVAEHAASVGNPHFRQVREERRQEQAAVATLMKSGLPEAAARALLRSE
jgi:hypothetical protein